MKRLLMIVVLGASLAGCATQTAQTTDEGGYASGVFPNPRDKALSDKERAQEQSSRDFMQPRGLYWP